MQESPRHDALAALRFRDFRLYMLGNFITTLGQQMVNVAIGWELYQRTRNPLALGGVGLAQIIPVMLFAVFGGQLADQRDRQRIVTATQGLLALGALGLALLSYNHGSLVLIYVCLFIIGTARAFNGPAASALMPQTIPPAAFSNAATWSSSAWQLASVLGPALGGLLLALNGAAGPIYLLNAVGALVFGGLVALIRPRPITRTTAVTGLNDLGAGLRFVWRTKLVLASITLDLFAVLLGGTTALLPIFAQDILHVGPVGLGWLRAAPSAGAIMMAVGLAALPPLRNAGRWLLAAVLGFGLATIVFGLSHSFALSLVMLVALGAFDNISVVIRQTLLMTNTPDEMRGRVGAVNNVFIGASNELGEFESGVAAFLLGPALAVIAGGIGTILAVGAVAVIWPEIRTFDLAPAPPPPERAIDAP